MANVITLTVNINDVLYQVRNRTHKTGKGAGLKDKRLESNLQADDTAQDTNIVTAAADKALVDIAMSVSRYVSSFTPTAVVLSLPDTWRTTNETGLRTDFFEFIVNSAAAEFLSVAGDGQDAKMYASLANASLSGFKAKALDRKSPLA